MQIKNLKITIAQKPFFLLLLVLLTVVLAVSGTAIVSHKAEQVQPGTFGASVGSGAYDFPSDVSVSGNILTKTLKITTDLETNNFRMPTGAQSGFVLTSDAGGVGTWQSSGSGSSGWTDDGTIVRLTTFTDSVGIGTSTPDTRLAVMGPIDVKDMGLIRPAGTDNFQILNNLKDSTGGL